MNEANQFYEDMQSRKQSTVIKKSPSTGNESGEGQTTASPLDSGNGEGKRISGSTTTKDGIPSLAEKDVNLTPNG